MRLVAHNPSRSIFVRWSSIRSSHWRGRRSACNTTRAAIRSWPSRPRPVLTSCAHARQTASSSALQRCTSGRSPAILTGHVKSSRRGRSDIRAWLTRTGCWADSARRARAATSRPLRPQNARSKSIQITGSASPTWLAPTSTSIAMTKRCGRPIAPVNARLNQPTCS